MHPTPAPPPRPRRAPPDVPWGTLSLVTTTPAGGRWSTDFQAATAGADARLRLTFTARDVYIVLGGEGTVTATVRDEDGRVVERTTVDVAGTPTLYPLLDGDDLVTGTVDIEVGEGLAAYSLTFG